VRAGEDDAGDEGRDAADALRSGIGAGRLRGDVQGGMCPPLLVMECGLAKMMRAMKGVMPPIL
jgi:hypothetical protein